MRNILLTMLILLSLIASMSGCATVEGLGKDMKKAGEWVEDKAK